VVQRRDDRQRVADLADPDRVLVVDDAAELVELYSCQSMPYA